MVVDGFFSFQCIFNSKFYWNPSHDDLLTLRLIRLECKTLTLKYTKFGGGRGEEKSVNDSFL